MNIIKQKIKCTGFCHSDATLDGNTHPILVLGAIMLVSKHGRDARLMACLFYISISIQGSLVAYKHQKALIVAP